MEFTASLLIPFLLPLLLLLLALLNGSPSSSSNKLPKSYPIIGCSFAVLANMKRRIQWTSDLILFSPNAKYVLHRPLGHGQVLTGKPATVQHILKTHFSYYQKGDLFQTALRDMLGDGFLNADGDSWKLQRQVSSHEFKTKSLRKFLETVVDTELNDRLIPFLSEAARKETILDMQDILQRFAFDNICNIAFGYDPACLSSSLPERKFAQAFEEAAMLSINRLVTPSPLLWKIKRKLDIGSEKRLKIIVSEIRDFARKIVREKKVQLLNGKSSSLESVDLLSRFLNSGQYDEEFLIDIVISIILAGQDSTLAALTWYFWLLSQNPLVENEVVREIRKKSGSPIYEDVKDMVYTHTSLCESMRLYPPVPFENRQATIDDILPDGTIVKKGMSVAYHPYAMGRSEKIWGPDWAEFRPERWLEKVDEATEKWCFVGRDSFTYPVFHAGPMICLGREMAFLQMKRVVSEVLRQFRVVPMAEKGVQPGLFAYLTSKMEGGFPVRIEDRKE
ncbi:cytochrome P450 94A2-like [Punica granatum]|uniref:Cytochrome P450 94A2-like n=2 Tax=Punica granatum TaxID=22663 RepID=A0A6P8E6K9_PUNGR|nr:cytochrome P450 94A2-like [Punica granatum]